MDTVNKVVDAGYKAIWGEQNDNAQTAASNSQTTTTTTTTGLTGIESVDKVIDSGKKAIWGDSTEGNQQSTTHGEEPVAGKRGLGTPTDPYDAGNRDEQSEAPPVEAEGLPTSIPVAEQRDVEKTLPSSNDYKSSNSGAASVVGATATTPTTTTTTTTATTDTAAAVPDLKTTVGGLKPDPSQPGNATDSTSRAVADAGPGQSLKHTSEPFEDETQKLAKDLQDVKVTDDETPGVHTVAGGKAVSRPNAAVHSKDDSVSSTSGASSNSQEDKEHGQKTKTSKLEKVKNKLHIGSHSSK